MMTDAPEWVFPAHKIGVLVPSANPAVEPELQRLLAPAAGLHAARFPVMPGTTLQERNQRYVGLYAETITAFGSLKLDAVVIGLTGPSYRLRPQKDAELAASLSASAGGAPVQTASGAIAQALVALGARRICLVSPYPAWLTDEAVGYWQEGGHQVVQVVKMSETFRAYELTTDEVTAALATVEIDAVDAVVISGTGMVTLPAILQARRSLGKPILSSNICCAWWALRRIGIGAAPLLGAVAPELPL